LPERWPGSCRPGKVAGMHRNVALVTAREALALDEDLPPLILALRELGARVATPCWDDPDVDWGSFDVAVLRSTWDYADRLDEFLEWTERCASQTKLLNSPAIVRWNTDKHYLVHLAHAGVPVVPTLFVEPGTDAKSELARFLAAGSGSFTVGACGAFEQFVVKPTVGAGSRDAARYRREDHAKAVAHIVRLLEAGRSVMLQPYLDRVDHHGETAVVYIGGRYSHAIRKSALLRLDDAFVAGLFAPEQITPREPDPDEKNVAEAAFRACSLDEPLYARIDLIHDDRGLPVVLELELTEPSLFFLHAPEAAGRFADALLGP
jgi:glutathione synthase/RimK-type ligase-like ATP-grasp enzyme